VALCSVVHRITFLFFIAKWGLLNPPELPGIQPISSLIFSDHLMLSYHTGTGPSWTIGSFFPDIYGPGLERERTVIIELLNIDECPR